jgi:hypothetical protein
MKTLIAISALLLCATFFVLALWLGPALAASIGLLSLALAVGIVLFSLGNFFEKTLPALGRFLESKAEADAIRFETEKETYYLETRRLPPPARRK